MKKLQILSFMFMFLFIFHVKILAETDTVSRHIYGGMPSCDNLLERQGYVLCFNDARRVPSWVAFRVEPDFRNTPQRKGRFKSFRDDPDLATEARDADYDGLLSSKGYARGHLAPYGVMGGDRDKDGAYAADDPDDARTVYEGNYMSNIAPQYQDGFNGSNGLWYALERWIQDGLIHCHDTIWVFAGCVFDKKELERVGPGNDIHVPPGFFQMVVVEDVTKTPHVLAFLFPHQKVRRGNIEEYLTSVDDIERATGLDFFSEASVDESTTTKTHWESFRCDDEGR